MLRALDLLMAVVAGALVATTAIVTCLSVFFRSVLNASLSWPVEVSGYLLIPISFAGAYLALRGRGHIAFDMLAQSLPATVRKTMLTIVDVGVGGFLLMLAYLAYHMIAVVGGTPLETVPLPRGLFMAAIPIGSVAMVLGLVGNIIDRWKH